MPPSDKSAESLPPSAKSAESLPPSDDITELREEIDRLDAEILRMILRRSEVSQQIGAIRRAEGGPRIVLSREQAVLARFRDLGPEGRELGMLLLRLGRGRLGRA
ncbi:MAG TPA: chorismate mutase [Pseudonocardia sp.]|nr:chorismate mutase [Pseudonocardia sp.]